MSSIPDIFGMRACGSTAAPARRQDSDGIIESVIPPAEDPRAPREDDELEPHRRADDPRDGPLPLGPRGGLGGLLSQLEAQLTVAAKFFSLDWGSREKG